MHFFRDATCTKKVHALISPDATGEKFPTKIGSIPRGSKLDFFSITYLHHTSDAFPKSFGSSTGHRGHVCKTKIFRCFRHGKPRCQGNLIKLFKVRMACLHPFKFYIILSSSHVCPTHWGPVIQSETNVVGEVWLEGEIRGVYGT